MRSILFLSACLLGCSLSQAQAKVPSAEVVPPENGGKNSEVTALTHGPVLGRPGVTSMSVWMRTSAIADVQVKYGTHKNKLDQLSEVVTTDLANDLTAIIDLEDLQPDTAYHYSVIVDGQDQKKGGVIRTIPDAEALVDPEYNPKGLFNFSFEFACGNNQNPKGGNGPTMPGYDILLRDVKDDVHFAILNGDWLYEEDRDYTPDQWRAQTRTPLAETPPAVRHMPNITGIWENYKTYLARAGNLAEWHRNVPSFYTFDDHELLNDGFGAGTPGYRNRRAVIRDVAIQGWYDYLGWSNPLATQQDIFFGTAQFVEGSDILEDPTADFTQIDWKQAANLHVHWGTPDAGVMDVAGGDTEGGNPNANIYDVVKVLSPTKLKLSQPAVASGVAGYSVGRHSYGKFRIGNCEVYLLDTRTHRELHDLSQRDKEGLTMIGDTQREWVMAEMAKSDADFFFMLSSVNFMIPHVGGGGHHFDAATKDDAWTAFLWEREMLINFWDDLKKPVFVLTGDLHNSFAIKVTDRVWEFASGPHNSVNHRAEDEGNRPLTGKFKFGPRECDIRWSTFALGDIPRENRMFPHYCVVQVNNVVNLPPERGGQRLVAFPHPQVMFKYYHGHTGELVYVESISTERE